MFDNILDPVKVKWATLSQRDQKAMLILSVALAASIIVFGIAMPIASKSNQVNAELSSAQDIYNDLVSLAPKALASGSSSANLNTNSINSEVRRQAARYGVEIQRFEPDGEHLKVWLDDARYPSVIQWLGGLEALGISHLELTMENRSKPGFVSVRVTFGVPI